MQIKAKRFMSGDLLGFRWYRGPGDRMRRTRADLPYYHSVYSYHFQGSRDGAGGVPLAALTHRIGSPRIDLTILLINYLIYLIIALLTWCSSVNAKQ